MNYEQTRFCPKCGNELVVRPTPNGPDDFDNIWFCTYCVERVDE